MHDRTSTELPGQRQDSSTEGESFHVGRGRPAPGFVFGLVATALFMVAIDQTIVATALPSIHRSLHASVNWAGWTITIYGLGTVVSLAVCGKLASQFGRRRVFLIGVSVFTAASLVCGFSTDIYVLIVFRALQALGGGAVQPSAAGLVADHFGENRGRAIGMFGVVSAAGQVVGPIAGGLLVAYLSWRWIFYVNVPIGIVLVALTASFVPESAGRSEARTDIRGLMLMTLMVLALIFGITSLGEGRTALDAPTFVVPEIAAVALLIAFIRHELRTPSPFIPLRLLRGRGFAVMNWINFLHGMVTFGIVSLVPLYAENRYHLTSLKAASLLTARAVGMIILGFLAAILLRRTGYRWPMALGFAGVAIGTVLMSFAPHFGLTPFAWLSAAVGIAGLGLGAVNPAASNACLHLAPEETASITGLRVMFINLGIIVSVSVTTAIINRSANEGLAQAHVFWAAGAVVFAIMLPLVTRVPEHRGSW